MGPVRDFLEEGIGAGVAFVEGVLLDLAEGAEAKAVGLVDLGARLGDGQGHGPDLVAKEESGG